ncbi:SURF1 family cytochrome oxidase biogenesis protein [Nocardioides pacificus]
MRLFLSRRWALFAVAVALLSYGAWWLGGWQFDRLEDRKDRNAVIERNEKSAPRPVEDVLAPGRAVDAEDEWTRVTATGVYDTDDTVIVRYRTRDGKSGINVVVPLVTEDGTAVLVDRGWMPTDNRGIDAAEVPQPAEGEVTMTGWVRVDATGDSAEVANQSTRSISSAEIGPALDREVYGGFVELVSEDPAPAEALTPTDLPDLDDGPHFFYGLQWWFFGVLAVFGFCYLGYDEWRKAKRKSDPAPADDGEPAGDPVDPSERPEHAPVDR